MESLNLILSLFSIISTIVTIVGFLRIITKERASDQVEKALLKRDIEYLDAQVKSTSESMKAIETNTEKKVGEAIRQLDTRVESLSEKLDNFTNLILTALVKNGLINKNEH